jgi:serine/threonine protein kinase
MSGGSLEAVVRDHEQKLPWRTRESIALHVALGMEHLHKKQLLHRDLKSANVLLDENLNAKVGDFGLSRIVRPARRQVVRSAFTGVTRVMSAAGALAGLVDNQCSMSTEHDSSLDTQDYMTKARGSLLWMAPEIRRGDHCYTKAVDV